MKRKKVCVLSYLALKLFYLDVDECLSNPCGPCECSDGVNKAYCHEDPTGRYIGDVCEIGR